MAEGKALFEKNAERWCEPRMLENKEDQQKSQYG